VSRSPPSPRSKAESDLADVESVFAALSNASRRHILLVLHFRGGEMTAGDIAARFACRWPTTTRHLRVLEAAGLVQVEKRGRERVYRLASKRLLGVTGGWLQSFRRDPPADEG
jgi:DNA-binding transcriptional ArsR family regulator